MKTLEIDEELYRYIAAQTQHIGESASDILRRLLFSDTQPSVEVLNEFQEEAMPEGDIIAALSTSDVANKGSAVERFIGILTALAVAHGQDFARVLELKGRNRTYFATSKEALLAAGSSTNPKALPETAYWVVTNNNTRKKAAMLQEVARVLGYNASQSQQLIQLLDPQMAEQAD
ncbi:Negative modulator of initiation of replication [Bowmanella dokdonensis]|uniref:Negative modulator of initiation of replication n=1 Tax=Bowmanella dokdonensis TaxID=751969 RepID=A0A939DKW1_9ALTE|nr:Negative modulator of initiation of replication [Bowmanella dokdonensis]MBN7824599.1 Negative modulator of initiation of replication [Bowmanella dokdonensis]